MHSFESQLSAAWAPAAWRDVSLLVAVSGGADSVSLLCGLVRLKDGQGRGRLAVGHFNHHLRGVDSDQDEAFVVDLSRRLGVDCRVGRSAAGPLHSQGDGLEAAARDARYDFFRHTAEELGARYVVTAHTAEDHAETILHRIIRGTGINGLAGIGRTRTLGHAVTVIRPMLTIHRQEILDYLTALGQPYRHDASNEDSRFTRNRIRHQLLPLLSTFNAGIVEALLRLGVLAGEVQTVVDTLVDDVSQRAVRQETAHRVTIDLAELAMQPRYLVREVLLAAWRREDWPLQAMGFAQWDELADLIYDSAGRDLAARRKTLPGGVQVSIDADHLRLEQPAG